MYDSFIRDSMPVYPGASAFTVSLYHLHRLTASLLIVTGLLARVAWIQLAGIKNTAQADFLIHIDDRYGSEPILKATHIIQRLYRESNNLHPGAPESVHRSHIAIRINEISENINTSYEYTYLLNRKRFVNHIYII